MNNKYLYRYRPTECMLDKFNELEKQEIYFAKPADLNDPFEGAIVPFFKGTEVHWKVLLRFLYQYIEKEYIDANYSNQYQPFETFATWQEQMFDSVPVKKIITDLSRKEQPHFTYESVEWLFQYVITPYIFCDFVTKFEKMYSETSKTYQEWETMLKDAKKLLKNITAQDVSILLRPQDLLEHDQSSEICELKQSIQHSWNEFCYEKISPPKFIFGQIMTGIRKFLDTFDEWARPKFRIASFSKSCNITSMWGMYAKAHNGICMKFVVSEDDSLKFINSSISDVKFYDVQYNQELTTLDTAYNILAFIDKKIEMGEEASSQEFWHKFLEESKNPYLRKLTDWSYEQEVRLLITDCGDQYAKLRYDFSSLESIIWGVKVPYRDRCKMVEIIKKKCEENKIRTFSFYEYSIVSDRWDKEPVYRIEL